MALGINVTAQVNTDCDRVCPVSLASKWAIVIDAGGPATLDNASITNPTTQITASTRHILTRGMRDGTTLRLQFGYSAGATVTTNPIVKVFGRYDSNSNWELLKTKSGSLTATFTTAATDASDGTLKYTTCDGDNHAWDCNGCNELLVGVETAFAVGAGITTNAVVQAKMI